MLIPFLRFTHVGVNKIKKPFYFTWLFPHALKFLRRLVITLENTNNAPSSPVNHPSTEPPVVVSVVSSVLDDVPDELEAAPELELVVELVVELELVVEPVLLLLEVLLVLEEVLEIDVAAPSKATGNVLCANTTGSLVALVFSTRHAAS